MSKLTTTAIDRLTSLPVGTYLYRRAYKGSLYYNLELGKWQLSFHLDPPSIEQRGGSVSCHQKSLIDTSFDGYLQAFRIPLSSGEAICFDVTASIAVSYRPKAHPYNNSNPLDLAHAGIFALAAKEMTEDEIENLIHHINDSNLTLI